MRMATCHPDKKHYAHGECKNCYYARLRRESPAPFRLAVKKYHVRNREKIRVRENQWRKKYRARRMLISVNFRLTHTLRRRFSQALKGILKEDNTLKLLGCSTQFLKYFLEQRFIPGMAWENYGTYWHIDHITPCAAFNLEDPEQQRVCFHYTNLQPLTREENLRKGATI